MKTLQILILLLLTVRIYGQDRCKERGHIETDPIAVTLMDCGYAVKEYQDSTVVIYHGCNFRSFTCARCGEYVTIKEEDRQVTIWRREE